MRRFPDPRRWTLAEIRDQAAIARGIYANRRPGEGRDAYRSAYASAVIKVRDLLEASRDLTDLNAALSARQALLDSARYVDAPPISADDLATISGFKKGVRTPDAVAARTAVIGAGIDPDRFPWVVAQPPRTPTEAERDAAVSGTAALIAAQRAITVLRNMWAHRQEQAVADVLSAKDYQQIPRRRIVAMPDLPAGMFCPESKVFDKKCDVPVGLRNGRYLLIECKVSGSEVNSYKRLNHETVSKRDTWERGFAAQAYTAAVLGGVFSPANVLAAQDRGVSIFWEHDLSPLADFLGEVG